MSQVKGWRCGYQHLSVSSCGVSQLLESQQVAMRHPLTSTWRVWFQGVVFFLREDLKRLMVGATVLHGKTSLSQPARLSHRPLVAFLDFLVAFNVSCRMGVRHLLVLSRTHPFNTRRTRCIASASKQKILPSRHKTHSISKRIDFHI